MTINKVVLTMLKQGWIGVLLLLNGVIISKRRQWNTYVLLDRIICRALLLWFGTHKEWRPLKKSFRYEAMWDRIETLSETMSHAWNNNVQDDSLAGVARKLGNMQDVLSTWALKDFCSIQNKIDHTIPFSSY